MDLFTRAAESDLSNAPLAERMRPRTLEEYSGQEHLLGEGKLLRRVIEEDRVPSILFWGPPGTGKTTLARIIAQRTGSSFEAISAVLSGVKEIREVVGRAQQRWAQNRQKTILFVDEIHRFNKAQQDALLPHVERGTLTLIGATTENPSFEVNSALLSRCRVLTLRSLGEDEITALVQRALTEPRGLGGKVSIAPDALEHLARAAMGDARRALTALEVAAAHAKSSGTRGTGTGATAGATAAATNSAGATNSSTATITVAHIEEAMQTKTLVYDKAGEEHYNVISAFIKAMRGSDPDAAIYYMVRMLEAGEDPLFILRRMVIFAAEDIGNADPRALTLAMSCQQALHFIGLPEGVLPMTQTAAYLALAPKSNTALTAYAAARKDVNEHGSLPVPMNIRNAPTQLMKKLGYGAGYKYPHNFEGSYVPEEYLPDAIRGSRYYEPTENGEERALKARLEQIRAARTRKP